MKKIICKIIEQHTVHKLSMYKDYIFAAIKIVFGIFVESYILSVGGIYSICVGLAKSAFFEGRHAVKDFDESSEEYKKNEYKYLSKMAFFILVGSLTYVSYISQMFFVPPMFSYGEIPAIMIAAVSFTELTLAIINLKKSKGALHAGLRCVNLTSALTAIVLTQSAILSFAYKADTSFYNALGGMIFGCLCAVIAITMLGYYFAYKIKTTKAKAA